MKQAQLFAGFTRSVEDATTDGVKLLTRQRNAMSALRTIRSSEEQVTKCILDYLCYGIMPDGNACPSRGWYPVRTPVGRMVREAGGEFLGPVGRPDYLLLNPHLFPSFMWIEMKATGEKPDPHQLAVMEVLRKQGHLVTWADSAAMFIKWYEELWASHKIQGVR